MLRTLAQRAVGRDGRSEDHESYVRAAASWRRCRHHSFGQPSLYCAWQDRACNSVRECRAVEARAGSAHRIATTPPIFDRGGLAKWLVNLLEGGRREA